MRMKRMKLRVELLMVKGRLMVTAESVATWLVPGTTTSAGASGDASAPGDADAPSAATRKVTGASFTFTPSGTTCGTKRSSINQKSSHATSISYHEFESNVESSESIDSVKNRM